MEKLSGSIYINTIFIGLFRYSINIAVAFLDFKFHWLGRKIIHLTAWLEIIFALLIISVLYILDIEKEYASVIRWLALSVTAAAAQLYLSNGIATGELFPTCVRTLAYSFAQFQSRLGVVLSPQLFLLSDLWEPLPYIVMGGLAMTDMLFFHFNVPETKGQPLMEDMPATKKSLILLEKQKLEELEKLKETQRHEEA